MHRDSGCADLSPKVAEDQGQYERRADHSRTLTRPQRKEGAQISKLKLL